MLAGVVDQATDGLADVGQTVFRREILKELNLAAIAVVTESAVNFLCFIRFVLQLAEYVVSRALVRSPSGPATSRGSYESAAAPLGPMGDQLCLPGTC